jgi:hypothetical protein
MTLLEPETNAPADATTPSPIDALIDEANAEDEPVSREGDDDLSDEDVADALEGAPKKAEDAEPKDEAKGEEKTPEAKAEEEKKETLSKQLADIARQKKRADQEIAAKRAELKKAEDTLAAAKKQADEFEGLRGKVHTDPVAVLKALGIDGAEALDRMARVLYAHAKGTAVPADAKAQGAVAEVMAKLEATQKRLEEMEQAREAERQAASQAQVVASDHKIVSDFLDTVESPLVKRGVSQMGREEAVKGIYAEAARRISEEGYTGDSQKLLGEVVADWERFLKKKAEDALALLGTNDPKATTTPPAGEKTTAKTLTHAKATARTPVRAVAKDEDEEIEEITRELVEGRHRSA